MCQTDATEDTTIADREVSRQNAILALLVSDPFPWTEEEIGRELSPVNGRLDADDPLMALSGAGLVYRFEVTLRDGPPLRLVTLTRAARQADVVYQGAS